MDDDDSQLRLVGGSQKRHPSGQHRKSWENAAKGEGGYDPSKFYTRATDVVHGHADSMRLRLPPDVLSQVGDLINLRDDTGKRKVFPDYKSVQDFVRDAIVHHLHNRTEQAGDRDLIEQTTEVLKRMAFEDFTRRMKEDVDLWKRVFEEARTALVGLLQDEAWAQMWVCIREIQHYADEHPDPYRTRFKEMIKEFRERVPKEYQD